MKEHKFTNRLVNETSPYLLQHAHNPVDWYPWGEEAFAKAREEDKPILVSIGYSTCHWCHVMERESFEDEAVADYMNQHYVNIKVDREERPDVDQVYMEAIQILSGSGGWPLNCFLTPDKRPFYGGTYFPPKPAYNRPSWGHVLQHIHQAFIGKRNVVEEQASRLTESIAKSDTMLMDRFLEASLEEKTFTPDLMLNTYYALRETFDRVEGGFGGAPKFPGTISHEFLLQYHHATGNHEALEHVLLSLEKMIMGGIYDQLGGGFARYATDREWLIPHFEKMLYDNALLVSLLANGFKLTHNALYETTIGEVLEWVEREMTSPEGAFYSAQDADSEGVEGKFFVWDKAEIMAHLGEADGALFCKFYGVSEVGNWEGKNILWRENEIADFAKSKGLDLEDIRPRLAASKQKLFEIRDKRIKPGLDDKVLLNWNALMCSAYADAYEATGNEKYKSTAVRSLEFMLNNFRKGNELNFYHVWKEGRLTNPAFLDDYAFLIKSMLSVYAITQETKYLDFAGELAGHTISQFLDKERNLFFFTAGEEKDLPVRRRDLYDNSIPSGNSIMVGNLHRLGILLGNTDFRQLAENMLSGLKKVIEKYPSSFAQWARSMLEQVYPINEIVITGTAATGTKQEIERLYMPNKVIMIGEEELTARYPLLEGKPASEDTLIYVCKDYTCLRPVSNIEDMKAMLS
ncbi:MAG: thioredoxin domain-containing protein [Bacteroidota bacterium]